MARAHTTTANPAAIPAVPMRAPVAPPTVSEPTWMGSRPIATPTMASPAMTAAITTSTMKAKESPLRQARSAEPITARVFAAAL